MRLTSIVWFQVFPARFGGQKGIALFEQAFAKHFEVSCICSTDNSAGATAIQLIPILPVSKFQFVNPFVIYKILRQVRLQKPDVLLLEHPYYVLAAVIAKRLYGLVVVLHEHNIEYARFKQLGKWWWAILQWVERVACKTADMVVFKTEEDRSIAVQEFRLRRNKTSVVPYCVSEKPFLAEKPGGVYDRHNIPKHHKLILFAGTLDYKPNADAVYAIFSNLAPLLSAQSFTIIVTGRNMLPQFSYLKELRHPNIIMAGAVENIDEYFYSADVFINPVLSGGGIQTKILDALSYHCPVVSFEKGLTGIDSKSIAQIHPVTIGDWTHFAQAIQNASDKKRIPVNSSFFAAYSWDAALAPVVDALVKKVHVKSRFAQHNSQN